MSLRGYSLTALATLTCLGIIALRTQTELTQHRSDFQREHAHQSRETSSRIESMFRHMHQSLRTIARLPGVRKLPGKDWQLSPDARATIDELYANLRTNVEVSELYIIPLGFDPSLDSPEPGHPNQPAYQFDGAIAGVIGGDRHFEEEQVKLHEEEAFEYAYMAAQLERFVSRCPSEQTVKFEDHPGAISPPLLTCDNSHVSPSAPNDDDRLGLVYSVPFYDSEGRIAGMICSVIRTEVLKRILPSGDVALVQLDLGINISGNSQGLAHDYREYVERLEPAPELMYSEVIPISTQDSGRKWALWVATTDAMFWPDHETRHTLIAGAALAGLAIAAGTTGAFIIAAISRRGVRLREQKRLLEAQVLERTEKLDTALRDAQAATKAKSAFLANMSHEIRTPMTAILGFSEILLDPELSPADRADHVHTIRRNADHLLTIINDILDVSKIEAGKMTLERLSFSPSDLAEEVRSLLGPRAAEKNLALNVAHHFPLPRAIITDPTRVRQVLVNLVGNAIKFTSKGSVTITLGLGDAPGSVRFDVTDTGIGLSPEQINQLFQPFSQADESTTRRFGGTGLGLALSKSLAQLMGGTLDVRSTPSRGSTFSLTIPIGVNPPVLIDPPAPPSTPRTEVDRSAHAPLPPLTGLRILLAEDGPDNQHLLQTILTRAGAEVTVAGNGKVAVQEAKGSLSSRHPFDVILMDMQMPLLDGYGATSQLRSEGYQGPIIALTAHAMASERDKCIACGCNDYATKPINKVALIEICERWGDHLPHS